MTKNKNADTDKKIFGYPRNIFFTGLTSFLTDTSVKMVYSVMPVFLLSIGASKTSLSLIEGTAESTSSLIKAFSGFWSDKTGKNKPLMLLGYGISALVLPLYAFAYTPLHVLWLRITERLGKGVRTAPRDSLIAGSVANNETGKGFGLQKAMDNSGAIAGPLIAFLVLTLFPGNFRLLFLLAGIPALFGILVILTGIREIKRRGGSLPVKFRFKGLSKSYLFFLLIIFIFTLGNSTDALLLIKANEVGVQVAFIPLVYLLTSVVSVLLAIPVGILSDRIGKEKILAAGFMVYALVYTGFARTTSAGPIMALFALYGLYSAATDGIQKALVADLSGQDNKGTTLGMYHALLGITLLPASLIAGILYDKINSRVPFYFGAVTALISAILMLVLFTGKGNERVTKPDV